MLLTYEPFRGTRCIQMVICLLSWSLLLLFFLPSEWFIFLVNVFAICSLTESSPYFKNKKREKAPVFHMGTVILMVLVSFKPQGGFLHFTTALSELHFKLITGKWKYRSGPEVGLTIARLFMGKHEQMITHLRYCTDDRPQKRIHLSLA